MTERKSLESERAELVALADRIEARLAEAAKKNGFVRAAVHYSEAPTVVAALRHLAAPPDSGAGKSAPLPDSSLPSGESDLSVMSDYGGADAINDPIERIVADGLMYAGVSFSHESSSPGQRLDFSLADGVMIECKQFHTSRISDQLAPFSDVILVQGRKAASWLKGILSGGAVPDHGGADAGVGEGWTSRKCPHCKGTGENLSAYIVDDFTRCNHCGGTGDEYAALSKPAPVAANASAEARLREALVQIQTVCTDRHDEALQFVASVVSRALYPHASDCDKQEER